MTGAAQGEHISRFFKCPDAEGDKHHLLEQKLAQLRRLEPKLVDLREEFCYYVASREPLSPEERRQILWLIEPNTRAEYAGVSDKQSQLRAGQEAAAKLQSAGVVGQLSHLVEIGPRLNFCSPFSTNAVSILRSSCDQTTVYRLERSTIYELVFEAQSFEWAQEAGRRLLDCLHDQMVEMVYEQPVDSFEPGAARALVASGEPWLQPSAQVDILGRGREALGEVSARLGLFFDDWDVDYYVRLFRDTIRRNPTVVECFDLAQSNSEHSRHWFFKGLLEIAGRSKSDRSLIDLVAGTQSSSNANNVIAFNDNSSAIRGFEGLSLFGPLQVGQMSPMRVRTPTKAAGKSVGSKDNNNNNNNNTRHIILTAETHNFPTGVAPFPGAATGTGGRIRDVQATGRGAHVIAGSAGYSFGNLLLDGHQLDWEDGRELYPRNLAQPWRVAIEASNGASDYGNKFGEPIICGFARSFGQRLRPNGAENNNNNTKRSERWEYLKPIMFTGGIGSIDAPNTLKLPAQQGWQVAKVGGPVYRIGIGGGAASSAPGDVDNKQTAEQRRQSDLANSKLNFNAVQRGDPEMEQKLNRVIRACVENRQVVDELGARGGPQLNPIFAIHDQGAGGNGNVLKEISEPLGAMIDANKFALGDHTVNVLELWAAEYQESNAFLASPTEASRELLARISRREKCPIDVVGQVDDSGSIRLRNFDDLIPEKEFPIDLKLEHVIGSMPRKVFKMQDYKRHEFLRPAELGLESGRRGSKPSSRLMMENFEQLLKRVLQLPSVGSKRYLTTKVDRCVTGLIAGQQCLGPLHTPIGDYALVALSHFDHRGAVTSIGEQPIKGLVSPVSNATMSVAEALTNMMFCVVSSLRDVKCSANWMWAAKMPGEGAKLLDACEAMCSLMSRLGIAVDGGKDSLSMSASVDPANSRLLGQQPRSRPRATSRRSSRPARS